MSLSPVFVSCGCASNISLRSSVFFFKISPHPSIFLPCLPVTSFQRGSLQQREKSVDDNCQGDRNLEQRLHRGTTMSILIAFVQQRCCRSTPILFSSSFFSVIFDGVGISHRCTCVSSSFAFTIGIKRTRIRFGSSLHYFTESASSHIFLETSYTTLARTRTPITTNNHCKYPQNANL